MHTCCNSVVLTDIVLHRSCRPPNYLLCEVMCDACVLTISAIICCGPFFMNSWTCGHECNTAQSKCEVIIRLLFRYVQILLSLYRECLMCVEKGFGGPSTPPPA